jgi:hypothetical protein
VRGDLGVEIHENHVDWKLIPSMTRNRILRCLATAALCEACVLPPASSGDLDPGGSADDGGGASSGAVGDDGATSTPGDADSTGDAVVPEPEQWSREVVVPAPDAVPCGVAIDGTGRVAVSWIGGDNVTATFWTRSGVRVFAPDGTEESSLTQESQIFESRAFASDGTLRIRGAAIDGPDHAVEWTRAYDGDLEQTWSQEYYGHASWTQCMNSTRGITVDASDHIATYEYVCEQIQGPCGLSVVRRHAPDGSLLWAQETPGNSGFNGVALASGDDGAVFSGAVRSWDASDEVEIRKHDAAGNELWMALLPGMPGRVWATPDGGAFVTTRDEYDEDVPDRRHRLDADGEVVEVIDVDVFTLLGPTEDASDFFRFVAPASIQRLSGEPLGQWDAPASIQLVPSLSAVQGDRRFATAGASVTDGLQPELSTLWVGTLTLP